MITIRYESRIDSGGLGEVYRAELVEKGIKVAVKRLMLPYTSEDVRRFSREVRLIESLSHTNIIKILFTILDADPPAFVMPLAESNLDKILPELRTDDMRRNLIFRQILEGLSYAHENGIIHRDIKPQNILVFNSDEITISDFGLGRFIDRDTTTLTMKGDFLGTILYAAPEQIMDSSQTDIRSDIYAVGKILYQMVTSRIPYPFADLTGIDGKYAYIIQKCTEQNPDLRYQSIRELRDDFELITAREFDSEAQTDIAQKLLIGMYDPFLESYDVTTITQLIKLFLENPSNEELYKQVLPRIPIEIHQEMIRVQNQSYVSILKTYDSYVNSDLPFSYCDVVADFYKRIFWEFDDFAIKRIILYRLLVMGHYHNRWYVRESLAEIVNEIKDVGLAKLTIDVFNSNKDATEWSIAAININRIHPLIREGLQQINIPKTIIDDEIPF